MRRAICGATLFLVLVLTSGSNSNGQTVPDVDRWLGGTASGQIGFQQGDPITLTRGLAQEGVFVRSEGFGFPAANNQPPPSFSGFAMGQSKRLASGSRDVR